MTWETTLTPFGTTNVVQPLFKDENIGIAFRSYLNMGIEPELNVTTDGGVTWSSLFVNGPMYARWFAFIPGTPSTWLGSSSEPGFEGLSYSEDDGNTWIEHTAGLPIQAPAFIDNATGWAGTWSNGSSQGILIYNGAPFPGGGPEIYEDFELYTSGEQLVLEALSNGIDYWDTWSNSPGSAEDPYITSDQAASGSNSVVIEGTNDCVLLFGNKIAGAYDVDFKIFVASGFYGYFNLLQNFAGTSSEWGMQAFFDAGGLGTVDAGAEGAGIFNYNYDEWIDVKLSVNLNDDFAEMFVNGSSVVTWVWSSGSFGSGTLNQLGAMNLYAWAENGTPKAYFDDIMLTETGAPGGDPEIVVAPTALNYQLQANQTDTKDFTITNVGQADLEYNVSVMYSSVAAGNRMPAKRSTGHGAQELKSQIILNPADLASDPDYSNGAPHNNASDEVTLHYDGENNDAIGLTAGGTFQVSAMFPASMVGEYTGMELTELEVYINDGPDDMTLKIYGQGTPTSPGTLIYEQAVTPTAIAWNYITLDTPVTISGGDIWVGYEVTHDAGFFIAGTDAGPAVVNGDWISTNGVAWDRLSDLGLDYNWNIRAVLEGSAISQWLTVDPMNGTVAPGNLDEINVTANSAGLDDGTYTANVVVASNDPNNPSVNVAVTLVVSGGSPPVTLAQLTFEEQNDWDLTFDPWTAIDVDAGATYGFTGTTFPGAYEPMAYIAFNPATTDPPMLDDPEIQPYAGERFGASFATVPPPYNDDWMISPQVQLGTGSVLNFMVKSYTADYGLEKFNVGVSTTGMTPGDFTMLNSSVLEAPVAWTDQTFDLSAYDGQLVYVAIQCVSEDAFVFMIDDVMVTSVTGIYENEMGDINIYPNPATNLVNIDSDHPINTIRIISYTGQTVFNREVSGNNVQINTNDFSVGV
ncbi:MAG: T9SS type A sorting domain-containing protein, partial [Gammaproteobacteria bacterium]|nr:T9SS type A sorting domain-containing protein [Gammaproteobacteria bacterium]